MVKGFFIVYNCFMYIIELIAKLVNEKPWKNRKKALPDLPETDYNETCSHIFLPIDSTNATLACSKCGLVIKNDPDKVKPKNPFNL